MDQQFKSFSYAFLVKLDNYHLTDETEASVIYYQNNDKISYYPIIVLYCLFFTAYALFVTPKNR